MTTDVIALTPRMPDAQAIVGALGAAGPDFRVQPIADGAVLQLCDDAGRPLLSVEAPLLLQVPGETARLLSRDAADVAIPTWWTEARASTAVPQAARLAAAFASHLAAQLNGTVWPPTAAIDVTGHAAPDPAATAQAPTPAAAQPAVDVLTDSVAVVIQDRPVIAMTAWLSDTLRACAASNRALQIVTPATARLSLPTRTALAGAPNRWVIRDDEVGYYDGLSGAQLHWNNGAFVPVDAPVGKTPVAPAFTKSTATEGRQLLLAFRTRHPGDDQLLLGGALETAWQTLNGHAPAGWSSAEPANLPWSRPDLTALARRRAPQNTWLTVVGNPDRPAIATLRISITDDGIEEDIILAIGHNAHEQVPSDLLRTVAADLVTRHGAESLLIQQRQARRDLTVPAHFEAFPAPVAFAIGHNAVSEVGLDHARKPPLTMAPHYLGPAAGPGLYYPLSESTSTSTDSWAALEQLMRHLRPAGQTTG